MTDPAILQAILRSDFYSFVQKVFAEVVPGEDYVGNWHLQALCFALQEFAERKRTRQLVAIPPRSLKSIAASVALPAWILGHDPSAKIIAVSYSQALADQFSAMTRQVMKSDWYRALFPLARLSENKDTESYFRTTAGGYRYATSILGTLTGMGGNFIIIDDPAKPDDMMSEAKRATLLNWYDQTLLSRLNDKKNDGIAIIMQRLHENDLIGHVSAREQWELLKLPAIAEVDQRFQISSHRWYMRKAGELLFPQREPREVLDVLKQTMGARAFSAQYNQNPLPLEGGVIEWKWFSMFTELPQEPRRVVQSWDCASKDKLSSDYSVCITAALIGEHYFILDVFRRRLNFPELLAEAKRLAALRRADEILIEDAAAGIQLIQSLRLDRPCRMPLPRAVSVKGDKMTRMHAASLPVEQGRVSLLAGSPWIEDFQAELLQFPVGRHDDQIDAFSQLIGREERRRANPSRMFMKPMFSYS